MARKKATVAKAKGGDNLELLQELIQPRARQVILDTETTGLSHAMGDRLLEIGCIEVVGRRVTGRKFHAFINPERDVPLGAMAVHGLSAAFLKDKPKFKEVAQPFLKFIKGAELVIHNAAFDVGFLNAEMARAGLGRLDDYVECVTDTLKIAKQVWYGKRATLDALCERLNIDNSNRQLHGALLDADLLAKVYISMSRGQENLLGLDGGMVRQAVVANLLSSARRDDFVRGPLVVLRANADEVAAHQRVVDAMDRENKKLSLYGMLARGLDPRGEYGLDGQPLNRPEAAPPPVVVEEPEAVGDAAFTDGAAEDEPADLVSTSPGVSMRYDF